MIDSSTIRRIAILTGGGDAPGLNAVIRAIVKTAIRVHDWEVLGIEDGFEGLLGTPQARPLGLDEVRGLLPRGGTILGTSNRGHFTRARSEAGEAPLDEAVRNLGALGVDALVTIGGDGTQTIAGLFAERGVRVVGVPKTIDNDMVGTDLTFGFNSALDIVTDALDRLHTTAESHDRVIVVEVMGRTTGWIALHAAVAGGADVALIPEVPFHLDRVATAILDRERAGRRFSIVVAAEGAAPAGGEVIVAAEATQTTSLRLGGVGHVVGRKLEELTGKETRVVVLGHLQRGGSPTAFDRILATSFGAAAVRALAAGERGCVVVLRENSITTIPIEAVAGKRRTVPLDSPLLKTAVELGIELGEDPARALA
jgi:phosphofructokinase-like protein